MTPQPISDNEMLARADYMLVRNDVAGLLHLLLVATLAQNYVTGRAHIYDADDSYQLPELSESGR